MQATTSTLSDNQSSTTANSNATSSQRASEPSARRTQQDFDAKSDASFDPLFDDEEEGHGESHDTSELITNPQHSRASPSAPSDARLQQLSARSLAPPKNAPPLLDASTYSTFSPDVLMTASIDGQVILWDKRSQGSKEKGGVGRLWMSEKTPPWCLSVSSSCLRLFCSESHLY
jgi:transcriptional activator SPT8